MGQPCRVAAKDQLAYVATGWAGVQMLEDEKGKWTPTCDYTIERYAVSSIAAWHNLLVLAGSDMKLYDISQPDKPVLMSTTPAVGNTKNIVGAGSYILCLYQDELTLRKMQKLDEVVARLKISGNEVCFDPIKQRAYVLQTDETRTAVTRVQAYSDSLVSEVTFNLPRKYNQIVANDSWFAVCNLNDVALYQIDTDAQLVGTRHFDNLAIRDIALTKENIFLSAVDPQSKGFLLILSNTDKDLKLIATAEVFNDGRALAVSKERAVVIGEADGKDAATIIDLKAATAPSVVTKLNVVEDAAAVTIRDETAIVGGRGMEIFSLT
jgi:hypothetical protein